jgi:hypothetical protein
VFLQQSYLLVIFHDLRDVGLYTSRLVMGLTAPWLDVGPAPTRLVALPSKVASPATFVALVAIVAVVLLSHGPLLENISRSGPPCHPHLKMAICRCGWRGHPHFQERATPSPAPFSGAVDGVARSWKPFNRCMLHCYTAMCFFGIGRGFGPLLEKWTTLTNVFYSSTLSILNRLVWRTGWDHRFSRTSQFWVRTTCN